MKFKVGDRVRIINVDDIYQPDHCKRYKNGDILTIQRIDDDDLHFDSELAPIYFLEYHCIELVTEEESKILADAQVSPVTIYSQHTISVSSYTLTLSTAELKALQSEIAKVLS